MNLQSFNGTNEYFELLSTQGTNALSNIKISNSKFIKKKFDKEVKSFVLIIEGSSFHISNIEIPNNSNKKPLQIMHHFIILQLKIGTKFQVEFHVRN
jgi:hypothetical protein